MKIIGIDEVGRGPLAGPVTVCAVSCDQSMYKILKKNNNLPAIGKDSKKLSANARQRFEKVIKEFSKQGNITFKISNISNKTIDSKGLSYSINKAIAECLKGVESTLDSSFLLDGGLKVSSEYKKQKTIIKGDEKEKIIAWASILAKVYRDNYMSKMSKKYPGYGFDIHKGYGTQAHRLYIKKNGLSDLHRRSFCKRLIF